MDQYKIIAIYEIDGITPKESHQYRIGRIGEFTMLNVDFPMWFEYKIGAEGTLQTSRVQKIENIENKMIVHTKHTIYVFDKL